MAAPDRVYHVFDTWDEELVQALGRPGEWDRFEREVARRMLSIGRRAKEQAQDLALFPDVADKPDRSAKSPLADAERQGTGRPSAAADVVESPPIAPSAPATLTVAEIMGEMPEPLRRTKPKPSFAPEALQELIDCGVDPDEAMERLQEQIDRWS
jgi:hypothetical protein